MEYGVVLGASEFRLKLYTDAAYALHTKPSSLTGPIFCQSHMQKVVTLSSAKSEIVPLVEGMKKLIPLSRLIQSI